MPVRRGGFSLAGPGLLFVVSGPSGAGKDTLVAALRDRMPRVRYSVSATTRAPRPGERDGIDYHFLPRARFEEWLAEGKFLETHEYNENLYGTPLPYLEETLREGYDVVMKPEVNGALAIKKAYPDATLIFLLPEKFSQLQKRLEARRTETTQEIAARMAIAHEELKEVRSFDYLVINEHGREADAVEDLVSIVRAERYRIHRYSDSVIRMIEQT
ncbi:MAG TPA: guanylate kinase [Candidatus Binatia bacterium]|nr:guanylate kinase [Candidatus Binatia bacterium]